MIRLIDIVFILLFGLIAVSQIDSTASIEPSKSTEASDGTPEGTRIIVIGVTKEGTYPVDEENLVLKNFDELRSYLTRSVKQADMEGVQIGIRIRANWDSPVDYGLSVAKLCKNLNISKGIDVIKAYTD